MNRRYRLHFDDYAIGENEKLYGDMAARGWFLEKRGAYFSRFRRGEPAEMRYRIEVSAPGFLEETDLPEEQVAVYEDCGWDYVASRGMIHVFASPAGSDAPEFYADPAQQAATLKALRRGYIWAWVPVTVSRQPLRKSASRSSSASEREADGSVNGVSPAARIRVWPTRF